MKTKKIILYGIGGHCNSVIDVIINSKKFQIEFFLDDSSKSKILKKKKIFNGKKFFKENKKNKNIHISFASIYNLNERLALYEKIKKNNIYNFPNIISSTSYVSSSCKLTEGIIILNKAIVNSNVEISENVIINTGSIIEHDVVIGKNSHISTGVIVNGGVKIGKNCFIGSGSIIKENIQIPDNTFVKMGSFIKK